MDITKPNDIFVATLNNPGATTSDLMTLDLTPDNTGLLPKDDYKQSKYVKDKFTLENGSFDQPAFDAFYKQASQHYYEMSDDTYLKGLNTIEYSPFDLTRPKNSKTFNISVDFSKDYNPFKQLYGRTSIYSVDDSNLSLRELAQQSKVFDTKTNEWSDKSANDLGIFSKFFGDTLVYAQWDADGTHIDAETGREINHKKGDWKTNDSGDLYLETLGNREIYGKQVVNPMDMLTTDGSFANQFDFMDSDSKTKSIVGVAFKTAAEIAPFLIPGVNTVYGGVRAAVGLASVLPTFYKSFEGMLLGDEQSSFGKKMTGLEGYMSKFNQSSTSDEGQKSMLSFEQLAEMTGSTFGQIYEQRAMASLSNIFYKGAKQEALIAEKYGNALQTVQREAFEDLAKSKLSPDDFKKITQLAVDKVPELQSIFKKQSDLAKALNLGYMALTSTADIYGQALEGGYDRRTAGFAALISAAGQYGIMTNNRMGDWFLDKTTGYTKESNRALMNKTIKPFLGEIEEKLSSNAPTQIKKVGLANVFSKFKTSLEDTFLSPSELAENLWKNALVEGVEEVTEQAVQDATKGMIDTMSYLGLTKKQGSFGGTDVIFSKEGFQNYLANFVGGVLGGAMFELNDVNFSKLLNSKNNVVQEDTKSQLYRLIASGHENEIISQIEKNRQFLGNKYMSPVADSEGNPIPANEGKSHADFVTDTALGIVKNISTLLDAHNVKHSDEDIIRRAILDEIVIKDLEKNRISGNYVGIEGIILDDWGKVVDKIGKLSADIQSAESENKDTKMLQHELNETIKQKDDILEGKNSGIYFDKMMVLLNKDLFKDFLSMDKQTYTKNSYNIDYNELPEDGLGLSKSRIDQEWSDIIEGKDLTQNLDAVTKAYVNWEKLLTQPLSDYTETGYSVERSEVYKNILDLKETLRQYNTSGTIEERKAAIDKFALINDYFKKLGQDTLTPQDIYKTDLAEGLIKEGLVKKVQYVKDENGVYQPIESDYTSEELNDPTIKESINHVMNAFPINPLDLNLGINQFNGVINSEVSNRIPKIQILENLPEKTAEQEVELSQLSNLSFPKLLDSNNTKVIQELRRSLNEDIINLFQDFANKNNESHEDILSDYTNLFNRYNQAINNDKIDSKLEEVDENGEIIGDKLNLLNKLNESYSLAKVFESQKAVLSEEEYNNLISDFEKLQELKGDELTNALDEFFTNKEGIIKMAIENYNNDLALKTDESVKELFDNYNRIGSDYEKQIDSSKPDFFKLQNYLFEFLLNKLESGIADEEIFDEAKKLYLEERQKIFKTVFDNTSLDFQLVDDLFNLSDETISNIGQLYNEIEDGDGEIYSSIDDAEFEIPQTLKDFLTNSSNSSLGWVTKINNARTDLTNYNKEVDLIRRFEALTNTVKLKSNPLYNFIRNFSLTLNSNSKVSKIMDILENETRSLKQTPVINNFIADNIREKDIDQALNTLKIIKTVINAMSTTQVSYGDPYGFIYTRQEFAKRNKVDSEINDLKTISSDLANLTSSDVDRLINKLEFYKQLSENNSGRMVVEQSIISKAMNEIFVSTWQKIRKTIPVSFLPQDQFDEIVSSSAENDEKLVKIEDLFYKTNKGKEEEVLKYLMKNIFNNIDLEKESNITRDVTADDISEIDLLNYITSTLVVMGSDWAKLNGLSLNKFDKAPFYNQELASRIIRASTINPALYSSIVNNYAKEDLTSSDFITFVLGGAGTGKTTAVFGLTLDQFRTTNDQTVMHITAPTDLQTDNLNNSIINSISEDSLKLIKNSKDNLFEKLGVLGIVNQMRSELEDVNKLLTKEDLIKSWENDSVQQSTNKYIFNNEGKIGVYLPTSELENLDLSNLPNLLLIDEITHFSFAEIHVLNEISKLSYVGEGNFMKIIAAGDPNQLGYFINDFEAYYQYNITSLNCIKTPILNSTIRSANSQQRTNNDFLVGLVNSVSKIYKNNPRRADGNQIAKEFINPNNYKLDYYQDDTRLNGTLITQEILKSQVISIANAIKSNPERTLGILSKDAKIPSNIQSILDDLNIPEENIKTFNPNNIQGSEVDYFIFDADLTSKYDTFRDKLKSFYTYVSRAKRGSIVIDSNLEEGQGYLERTLRITNNAKSLDTQEFESLSEDVIKKAKEDRKERLDKILNGNYELSEDAYFKWKTGSNEEGDSPKTGEYFMGDNADLKLPIAGGIKTHSEEANENTPKVKYKKDDFKLILYSFYKNANADIDISNTEDKIVITKTDGSLSSDLGVTTFGATLNKNEFENVEKQWLDLRNELINTLTIDKKADGFVLRSDYYKDFLKYVFKTSEFNNPREVDCKFVITATKYNESSNRAYNKSLDDTSRHLKNGDLFLNISAELSFKGVSHFVTLASFPSRNTLMSIALNNVEESDKAIVGRDLTNVLDKLQQDIETGPKVFEINTPLSFLTGTRLLTDTDKSGNKVYPKIKLSELSTKFKEANFEEIKLYPSTYDEFKKLIINNYFNYKGESEQEIEEKINIKGLFEKLKNKPYIRVTFSRDGSYTDMGKLIPIYGVNRNIEQLTKDVEDNLTDLKEIVVKNAGSRPLVKEDFSLINLRGDMMLNKSNVLDILIQWGITKETDGPKSLLDKFTEKVTPSTNIFNSGGFSMLDIVSRFQTVNESEKTSKVERLETAINVIKEFIKNNPGLTNKEIKDKLLDPNGGFALNFKGVWSEGFHNLFAYKNIITSQSNKDFEKIALIYYGRLKGDINTEDFQRYINDDTIYDDLSNVAKELIDNIPSNQPLYYSLPIISENGIKVNPQISGKTGFNNKLFDNFYIETYVESPNLLTPWTILPTIYDKQLKISDNVEDDYKKVKEETFEKVNDFTGIESIINNIEYDETASDFEHEDQRNRLKTYLSIIKGFDRLISNNKELVRQPNDISLDDSEMNKRLVELSENNYSLETILSNKLSGISNDNLKYNLLVDYVREWTNLFSSSNPESETRKLSDAFFVNLFNVSGNEIEAMKQFKDEDKKIKPELIKLFKELC